MLLTSVNFFFEKILETSIITVNCKFFYEIVTATNLTNFGKDKDMMSWNYCLEKMLKSSPLKFSSNCLYWLILRRWLRIWIVKIGPNLIFIVKSIKKPMKIMVFSNFFSKYKKFLKIFHSRCDSFWDIRS